MTGNKSIEVVIGKESKFKLYTVSILFTLFVGFSFLFAKLGVGAASPLELITYRFNIAVISILIALAFKLVKMDLKKKSMGKLLVVALCYGGFIGFQAIGLKYATSIEGGIIFAVIPILTMIMAALLLKEKTNNKQKIFVSLSVLGVVLMFIMSAGGISGMSFIGLIILFFSSFALALSNVLNRKIRRLFTPTEISFVIVTSCCILFNIVTFADGLQNGTLNHYFDSLRNLNFLVSVIYLGVTCTFLTSLMNSYLLARMEAVKVTLFGNASTAISILAGVLLIGEPLQLYHILCTALIIVGVAGTSLARGKIN